MPGPFLPNHQPHDHPSVSSFRVKEKLKRDFDGNTHNIFALAAEEFVQLWVAVQKQSQLSIEAMQKKLSEITGLSLAQTMLFFGANYGSATIESTALSKLAYDFKKSGNILGLIEYKRLNGKKYIIFKGRPGLRKIITGTRYLASNAKLMSVGIGAKGSFKGLKSGFLISIFFSITLNTVNWLFEDDYRWTHWLATTSTDIIKVVISGVAAALVTTTLTIMTATFVVPIALGIAVALMVSGKLNEIDDIYALTDSLTLYFEKKEKEIVSKLESGIREVLVFSARKLRVLVHNFVEARIRRLIHYINQSANMRLN